MKIVFSSDSFIVEFLYLGDFHGDITYVKDSGAPSGKWILGLTRRLWELNGGSSRTQDKEIPEKPVEQPVKEAWLMKDAAIPETDRTYNKLRNFRCPRCLAINPQGMARCWECYVQLALRNGEMETG